MRQANMGIMISCKKSAELICASIDRPLTLRETLLLRFHLFMCTPCSNFKKQNEKILLLFEKKFLKFDKEKLQESLPDLPDKACENLKEKIQAELKK